MVLDDATTVVVKGRADRIDLLEHDGRQYVLVYDYKSKAVKFPEADALIGEPLQALAYLLALESEGQPGGLIARCIPIVGLNKGYVTDGSADRIRMYRFRPRGLFRTELSASLDPALTPGRHSEVVAVRMNKDGTLHAQMSKDAITGTDLNDRLAVTRAMLTSGAAGVMQGCNDISPLVVERTLACRECDFAQICRFELSYNDPRDLERVVFRCPPGGRIVNLTPMQLEVVTARGRGLSMTIGQHSSKTEVLAWRCVELIADPRASVTSTNCSSLRSHARRRPRCGIASPGSMSWRGRRRAHLLRQRLRLDGAEVSTIDKWCARAGTDARASHRSVFRVGETADGGVLRRQTLDECATSTPSISR